ncbi:MAG TPA: heavy metal-binding domain-containing protein [Hyphomicrobiaceae bacterium]|nr:heavy metal-binding domain-containing protein [Hyphomicrobiaceae bacterium]
MRLVTTDTISDRAVRQGDLLYATAVSGANIFRDVREAITNTLGGRMSRYEKLLDLTIARALEQLAERAREKGYDGVLAVRISHPEITDGAIEVVVCGTGFNYAPSQSDSSGGQP